MAVNDKALRLARRMRVQLGARVDEQVRDLVKAWVTAWDELVRAWDEALDELVGASVDGKWPTPWVIARAEKTAKALAATQTALEDLSKHAGVRITADLHDTVTAAATWEARILAAQMPDEAGATADIVTGFSRMDADALDWIVRRTTERITSLTLPLSGQATRAMNATLIRGVALGDNPRTAAAEMLRRVEGDFNGGLSRALTIARTEMLDAHRAAARGQDMANLDVTAGWTWLAGLSTRTCPACLAMNGSVHPASEGGPDGHPNCRCARVPLLKPWRDLGFDINEPASLMPDAKAWFDAQPEADQVAIMGRERLDLLRSGRISWSDNAVLTHNPGWRPSWGTTPMKSLRILAAPAA